MSKILVTGSRGFIGRNLVPKLSSEGHTIITLDSSDGDIAEETTWANLQDADVVIHLAAKTFVPDSWTHSQEFMRCNVLGTLSALNYCKNKDAHMIFVSSYLYGNPDLLPIREDAPLHPGNPYALSKKLAEELCAFYAKSEGINITIIRPFNIYGPGQPSNFLIPYVISQVKQGEPVEVKDLEPKRDYIFIEDFLDAVGKAVLVNSGFNIINIGSGKSYSVAQIIQLIQGIFKTNLPVISAEQRRKDEIMDTVADIQKANDLLGWKPATDLLSGLKKTIESYT